MKSTLIKSQSPKPNLRIRIPPQRPDEEILRSPIDSPPPSHLPAFVKDPSWLKKAFYGKKL
jgi:hypothetical protein